VNLCRLRRDDGRVSVWVAIAFTAIVVIIGLAVDGSGRIQAMQRADNIAAEAARAGGQAIDGPQAIPGGDKVVDPALAVAAAQAYLDAAGATGDVSVASDRRRITVIVTISYDTKMLNLIGIDRITVTGQSSATLVTG